MNRTNKLFFSLLFAIILFSCKKEAPLVEEPVVPEVTTGTLSGKVTQYDQYGTAYTSALNTTTVSIDSTNLSCITDEYGRYAFNGLSSGRYHLVFKKPACGTIRYNNINFKFSDTTTYNVGLSDIPTFLISSAYLKDTTWFTTNLPGIYYNAGVMPQNNKATIVGIVGKSPALSLGNPLSYIQFLPPTIAGTTDYNRFLSYDFLSQSYGFKKDSMIYLKIYAVGAKGASYYDNEIKKPVYTAYGNQYQLLNFKMPQ